MARFLPEAFCCYQQIPGGGSGIGFYNSGNTLSNTRGTGRANSRYHPFAQAAEDMNKTIEQLKIMSPQVRVAYLLQNKGLISIAKSAGIPIPHEVEIALAATPTVKQKTTVASDTRGA
jgi:hypothetical protein